MSLLKSSECFLHSWASASRSIRQHRHSGICYLRPVLEQSGTWLDPPYSGTWLIPASAFLFIPVLDWPDAEQSDIPAFKNTLHRWKRIHTPCTYTLQSMDWDTPCTFALLVVERYTPSCPYCLLAVENKSTLHVHMYCWYWWWWKIHQLHAQTAGSGKVCNPAIWCWKIICQCQNVRTQEKKINPASAFLPVVHCLSLLVTE